MPAKPTRRQVLNTQPIDPAVAQLLGSQERRENESHLSRSDRKKRARQREKDAERKGKRVNWDIREDIKGRIARLAEGDKTTQSQVANLLLWIGLQASRQGKINISDYLRITTGPRYEASIEVPQNDKDLF